MALKPYAEAQASIGKGPVDIEDAQEYAWLGDGHFLMHNLLSEGQLVQFVVSAYEQEAVGSDRWHRTASADELRGLFQDWPPHLKKAVEEVRISRNPLVSSLKLDQTKHTNHQHNSCYVTSRNNLPCTSGSICQPTPMRQVHFV